MNLKQKLVALTLLVGIVPALIIGLVSLESSRATLEKQVFEQLQVQRNIKVHQIQQHFKNAHNGIETLADNLSLLIEKQGLETAIFDLDQRGQSMFSRYTKRNGYYDLFLLDPQGYCFFSVAWKADYKTNLVSGPYKDSGLGQVVQNVIADQEYHMTDVAPYAPRNGASAVFIAVPVIVQGDMVMVLAMQIPFAGIDHIIAEPSGMGEIGDTYLVTGGLLAGSDSLLGSTGSQSIFDHSGNPVLSSYSLVSLTDGVQWTIVSEIGAEEAFAPIAKLQSMLLTITGAGAVFLVLLALSFAETVRFSHRGSIQLVDNLGDSKGVTNNSVDGAEADVRAMGDELAYVSRSITEIIAVIDDLAFQANLAASNDSDKATRVGGHGAVASEEVRALAQRAADALADKTAELNQLMQFFKLEEHGQASALTKTKPMPEHQDIKSLVSDLRS